MFIQSLGLTTSDLSLLLKRLHELLALEVELSDFGGLVLNLRLGLGEEFGLLEKSLFLIGNLHVNLS